MISHGDAASTDSSALEEDGGKLSELPGRGSAGGGGDAGNNGGSGEPSGADGGKPRKPLDPLSGHSSLAMHYGATEDVVLRYDTLSDRQVKNVILLAWSVILFGLLLLAGAIYFQETKVLPAGTAVVLKDQGGLDGQLAVELLQLLVHAAALVSYESPSRPGQGRAKRPALILVHPAIAATRALLSASLPACLPVCLPACLPACLPTCLPACLPACMPALQSDKFFMETDVLPITNLVFSSICLAALLGYGAFFCRRVLRVNASGKHWTHRRRRLASVAGTELAVQLVSIVFFLAPNAYILSRQCGWFDSFVVWAAFIRWTCWNCTFLLYLVEAHSGNPAKASWRVEHHEETGQPIVMDGPLWWHWKKLLVWGVLQATYLAVTILVELYISTGSSDIQPTAGCRHASHSCSGNTAIVTLASVQIGLHSLYFALYAWLQYRSLTHLKRLPYTQHRHANFIVRLQVRLRGLNLIFFLLSITVYTFLGINTCRTYLLSWLGFLPVQMVTSFCAIINAYVMTPVRPHQASILRVWLQEFAWTEAELPRKRQQRASSLPPGSAKAAAINREPLFCVETALKMLFWSMLCYDHEEVPDSLYTAEDALAMYRLDNFEQLWEPSQDTKCLVGWNEDTLVVGFRGTASLANVKADLQMWRTRWPEGVGNALLGTAPMIHWGFRKAWTANRFDVRLLSFLRGILGSAPPKSMKVYVTGHSLGGALATLCAYELATQFSGIAIQCYTFGAPRTGNHAHARMYNQVVPDTWHVINNDDMICRGGKFFVLYKRCGLRVLINRTGDLIVRPSHADAVVRQLPGATSIMDHLLTSYAGAMEAVLGVQFGPKSLEKGREGVLRLARQTGASTLLRAAGLTQEALTVLEHEGWDALLLARRQAQRARRRLPWSGCESGGLSPEAEAQVKAGAGSVLLQQRQQPGEAEAEEQVEAVAGFVLSQQQQPQPGEAEADEGAMKQQQLACVVVAGADEEEEEDEEGSKAGAFGDDGASGAMGEQQAPAAPADSGAEGHAEGVRTAQPPSTFRRLLSQASVLGSRRGSAWLPKPELRPTLSIRGPLRVDGDGLALGGAVPEASAVGKE